MSFSTLPTEGVRILPRSSLPDGLFAGLLRLAGRSVPKKTAFACDPFACNCWCCCGACTTGSTYIPCGCCLELTCC